MGRTMDNDSADSVNLIERARAGDREALDALLAGYRGRLRRMVYVPGSLFSVNPVTARGVPGLFARNERVVCIFDTPLGTMALVLVGATIVGSMATVWHGTVNPPRSSTLRQWTYDEGPAITLRKGEEMGRFLLGSTVVLLFEPRALRFTEAWEPARAVRLGEPMGWPPQG